MVQLLTGHVFMSYSRKDSDVMQRTAVFLRKQGIKVWVDNEKLIPGTPIWEEEIEKAIRSASAIVVVLSPDAKNSEWVRREISLADQNHKRIFPVLVRGDEDSSISLRLITRQFVDFRNNEKLGLASLHSALSEYLSELDTQLKEKPHGDAVENINEKATAERIAGKESSNIEIEKVSTPHIASQTLLWLTLAWIIGGLLSGFIYTSSYEEFIGEIIGGVVGGAIGGFVTAMALRNRMVLSNQESIIRITLGWGISGAIGWLIGWGLLTEATGAGIGMAFFAVGGLISTFGINYIPSNWKSIALITLAWAIGGAIGWIIAKPFLIEALSFDIGNSWTIGTAIGWGIGGFVMGWQLLKNKNNS